MVKVSSGKSSLQARESGSETACVGVVGGTGLVGMRVTESLPYFVSGVAYPDLFVAGPEMLNDGSQGVHLAGFFGMDWSVEKGRFVGQ